eukprot:scaffold95020_cov72-Phaeocystis_antarctica.AAC.4
MHTPCAGRWRRTPRQSSPTRVALAPGRECRGTRSWRAAPPELASQPAWVGECALVGSSSHDSGKESSRQSLATPRSAIASVVLVTSILEVENRAQKSRQAATPAVSSTPAVLRYRARQPFSRGVGN